MFHELIEAGAAYNNKIKTIILYPFCCRKTSATEKKICDIASQIRIQYILYFKMYRLQVAKLLGWHACWGIQELKFHTFGKVAKFEKRDLTRTPYL